MNDREDYYPGASRDRGRMKKVVKKIELDICFDDGFVPPKRFDEPRRENDWRSACDLCPFFKWYDERGYGCCVLLGEEPKTDVCPIKKSF